MAKVLTNYEFIKELKGSLEQSIKAEEEYLEQWLLKSLNHDSKLVERFINESYGQLVALHNILDMVNKQLDY